VGQRWGVVSDIHGNLPALQAVVADAGAVDGWLNLGDIVSGFLWPAETAEWLMAQGWPTIAGNHERQTLNDSPARQGASDRFAAERLSPAQRDWLAALPATHQAAPGLFCVHGTPHTDLVYLLETVELSGRRAATAAEVDERLAGFGLEPGSLVLCGHSHVQRTLAVAGVQVLNPGSVGLQAFHHDWPHPHTVASGSPLARYAVVTGSRGEPGSPGTWSLDLRQVVYDWEAAAQRAESSGAPDWAHALRTGQPAPL